MRTRGVDLREGEGAGGQEWSRAGGGNARGLAGAPRAPWTGLHGWERGGIEGQLGPPS